MWDIVVALKIICSCFTDIEGKVKALPPNHRKLSSSNTKFKMGYLISIARTDLHIFTNCDKPKSETSEPDTSRISQELSANATIISSFSRFLRLAIAAIAIYTF